MYCPDRMYLYFVLCTLHRFISRSQTVYCSRIFTGEIFPLEKLNDCMALVQRPSSLPQNFRNGFSGFCRVNGIVLIIWKNCYNPEWYGHVEHQYSGADPNQTSVLWLCIPNLANSWLALLHNLGILENDKMGSEDSSSWRSCPRCPSCESSRAVLVAIRYGFSVCLFSPI